ncbi:hypothetical protein [Streptomyces sp. NBC_00576]|uniref:hypothetical protein n=1 Tax=Streptomyces sp. NBC_00576 TaxID=2903665 RepID=UPI002E81A94B|nr:hypothetical protein [Streptomyces sp. NBC_00576]WUB77665.1 hypothetical protein OG734_46585 [Streptomyces sp. NBC_00576]
MSGGHGLKAQWVGVVRAAATSTTRAGWVRHDAGSGSGRGVRAGPPLGWAFRVWRQAGRSP